MFNDTIRPRRLRTSDTLRRMVRETRVSADSLIWPLFVVEGEGIYREIPSLPGQYHYSPDQLYRAVERMRAHGVSRVILFGLPAHKDETGSGAWDPNGVVQQGIRALRGRAALILTTNDLGEAEQLADRIAVLSHGRLAALGTTGELMARAGAASFEDAFVRLAGGEG